MREQPTHLHKFRKAGSPQQESGGGGVGEKVERQALKVIYINTAKHLPLPSPLSSLSAFGCLVCCLSSV